MAFEARQNQVLPVAQPLQFINTCNHSARPTLAETELRNRHFKFDFLLNSFQEIYDGAIPRRPK
jgi:hypothetical protein